jgi:hypothetical protein
MFCAQNLYEEMSGMGLHKYRPLLREAKIDYIFFICGWIISNPTLPIKDANESYRGEESPYERVTVVTQANYSRMRAEILVQIHHMRYRVTK